MKGFFAKTVNDLLFPQKNSTIDIWHGSKCRSSRPKVFYKKMVLVEAVHRKKPVIESLKEETLAQMFSCEF